MKVHLPLFLISCLVSLCLLPSHSWAQGSDPCSTTPSFTALADLCIDAGVQTGLSGASPTGGTYSGPGVTDNGNGTYSFDPSAATAGTHTLTYEFPGSWVQVGADIDGMATDEFSGSAVAFSSDGNRMVIGAQFANSFTGLARIYEWDGSSWNQLGSDIPAEASGDQFGWSVTMSADGERVAIGATQHDAQATTGIRDAGHVRVFEWDAVNSEWDQLGANLDGSSQFANFGSAVSFSDNGNILAIGAYTGQDASGAFTGIVQIFQWDAINSEWDQLGANIDGATASDNFGEAVSLSGDGTRVAIGGSQNDGGGSNGGHAQVYEWDGSSWNQLGSDIVGMINASVGYSIAISGNGNRIAVGAPGLNTSTPTGKVQIFEWGGSSWNQLGTDISGIASDEFGWAVSLSDDGSTLAIGAIFEDLVRVYNWDGSAWTQLGPDIERENFGDQTGYAVSLSADGSRIAIGSPANTSITGHVRVFEFAAGCSASDEVVVIDPVSPVLDVTEASCNVPGQIAFTSTLGSGEFYYYSTDGINFNKLESPSITLAQGPSTVVTYYIKTVHESSLCESALISEEIPAIDCATCSVSIDTQPQDATICAGDPLSFEVLASGTGTLSYQWQVDNGSGFEDISGSGSSLSFAFMEIGGDGNQYQVIVTSDNGTPDNPDDDCEVTSDVATLTVLPLPEVSFTALADLCEDAGIQENLGGGSPTGGTYSGPGVTDNGDGTYDFDPSVAGVGPHTLMYSYQASSGWDQLGSELTGNSGSFFGSSVDISSSGNRIIIGALGVDETVQDGGEAYVYEWNGTTWVQLGTDFIGEENNKLGSVVRISNGGNRIAISSPGLALSGRFASGFVRVFDWNGSAWIQVGSDIEASSGNATAFFGTSMDLSGDGNRIVVGNSFFGNKVEVFDWDGNDWNKIGVDLGPERSNDRFGTSVSLSEDGKLLAIGATEDNLSLASPKTGYAKVYQEVGGSWVLTGLKRTGDTDGDDFGSIVDLSADGSRLSISSRLYVRVFDWNGSNWVQSGSDISNGGIIHSMTNSGNRIVALDITSFLTNLVFLIGMGQNGQNKEKSHLLQM